MIGSNVFEKAVTDYYRSTFLVPIEYTSREVKRPIARRLITLGKEPRLTMEGYSKVDSNGLMKVVNQCGYFTSGQAAYWLNVAVARVKQLAVDPNVPAPSYTIWWAGRKNWVFTPEDLEVMKEYLYGKPDAGQWEGIAGPRRRD